jgi:phosphate transport system substrate-binding protein
VKLTRTTGLAGAATAAVLAIAGCSGSSGGTPSGNGTSPTAPGHTQASACASGTILGGGSSFQDPMEQTWIEGFHHQCADAQIHYDGTLGSGTGISEFGSGSLNFAGSDVAMVASEQQTADSKCGSTAIHIPITAGGVGVTYKLSGVNKLQLSAPTIAKIFTGKVTKWNDPAIAGDNPTVHNLPSKAIHVITRSDPSGTTAVFTGFLTAAAPSDWTLGSDKQISFPAGIGKPGSAGVAQAVSTTEGGIGYVEQAYAAQNHLALAQVQNGGGHFVQLTPQSVATALAGDKVMPNGANDLTTKINFTPKGPNAYPISTVSYVIVCTKYPSSFSGEVGTLKAYLKYAVTTGQQKAVQTGFAALPKAVVTQDEASIDAIS